MYTVQFIVILYSITNVVYCDVYYVTPDVVNDTSCCLNSLCGHCYNLQHYLLNVSKYFTSNTQLHLLPGLHYLPTNLVIKYVSNISLIGRTVSGRCTTIQCTGKYHIILRHTNKVTIKDLVVTKCGFDLPNFSESALHTYTMQLYHCSFVTIINIKIMSRTKYGTLTSFNTMGHSVFHNISSARIILIYHDSVTTENYTSVYVQIDNYQCNFTDSLCKIIIMLHKILYIQVQIVNIKLCKLITLYIDIDSCTHYTFEINDCICVGEIVHRALAFFKIEEYNDKCGYKENTIQFKNCHFINVFRNYLAITLIEISSFSVVTIIDCTFIMTTNVVPLKISKSNCKLVDDIMYQNITTTIKNTSFISNTSPNPLMYVSEQVVLLEGPVVFISARLEHELIDSSSAVIYFHNYIEISNCSGYEMFQNVLFLVLKQPVTVNIEYNNFLYFNNPFIFYKQSICMFQYFNDQNLDSAFAKKAKLNYSIIFKANKWISKYELNSVSLRATHCKWFTGSAFNVTLPVDVNQRFITFMNQTFVTKEKNLCCCSQNGSIDCYTDQLGPIYPGETLNIMLAYPHSSYNIIELIIDVHDTNLPATACKIFSLKETKQIVTRICTELKLTVLQVNSHYKWCELKFKAYDAILTSHDAFYVRFYPCPAGFTKINGRCQCDPILKSSLLSIDDCDINDQTISRPANSWISATTNNGTFTYLVSANCPLDYCIPYPSDLKLSLTADLQCQFRRHNLLCGQCLDGLSTVFGSSHCLQCSNVNMFIIVPIAILGLLLVVLLFFLNLTVADGTINAFILYVNILSINSTILFPLLDTASVVSYIFISISNLDMGIKMCFYDGMDDYAKMWLQLLFPLYLIVIAAILIMTSRYSSKVQRLTARRALPVLATLFLLSYTKILRTVSSVLFSYSTIIHLPSNHSKLIWSVDANVDMLEIKFIILFIVCLAIFIFLIPFNITLLFTRTLSRFKIVNYFKPLLDAYQGPFKIKFYYWTGLHLVMKAVFFGLSALDKNVNLLIGSMILFAIVAFVGYTCPYKNWFQNCNEMILLFNIHAQYVLILSSQSTIAINVMIALAAVQFIFIMIYHIFTYTPAEAIKNKMKHCVSVLANIKFRKRSTANVIYLHDISYRNKIPDITYDYSEYQEPLVGED